MPNPLKRKFKPNGFAQSIIDYVGGVNDPTVKEIIQDVASAQNYTQVRPIVQRLLREGLIHKKYRFSASENSDVAIYYIKR